jgi:hypothetical protein
MTNMRVKFIHDEIKKCNDNLAALSAWELGFVRDLETMPDEVLASMSTAQFNKLLEITQGIDEKDIRGRGRAFSED